MKRPANHSHTPLEERMTCLTIEDVFTQKSNPHWEPRSKVMGGYFFLLVTAIATTTATIAVNAVAKNIPNWNSIFIDS